jgi:hypothetical protein
MRVRVTDKGFQDFVKKLDDLKNPVDRNTAKELGDSVRSEMLDMIQKGISPIRGNGRFPRYKNPKRYPGDQKPKTPVNLRLTGEFLSSLSLRLYKSDSGFGIEVFYKGEENEVKELGHRDGANGQPKRPTIPSRRGEQFAARITRIIRDIFQSRINTILNR